MAGHVIKNHQHLISVLQEEKQLPGVYLGEILVESKVITKDQLEVALKKQIQAPGKLGKILIEMGIATNEEINAALCRMFGIPSVKLQDFEISQQVLSSIPADLALQYNVLPLGEVNGRLVIAMENPLDLRAVEALRFSTNQQVDTVMASTKDISLALSKYYSTFDEAEALQDTQGGGVESIDQSGESEISEEASDYIEQQASKKPIVRLLNAIVLQGVIRGASDINIRPEKENVSVYYRVDGKLQFSRTLSKFLLAPLISRVKIIGSMNIAERRLPQDGHARLSRGSKTIDLRISIIPTINGESVVIRVLDKESDLKPFDELGLTKRDLDIIKKILARPHGMFLVTGPTGSGKSTTLYAILKEIRKSELHILTVEDPVEYDMAGVEQVQIALKKGVTFAEALKHFLRHDPDVIMVGEIRDEETAEIANKAALTGHMVLSTLHTNDAVSTITRLLDMGLESYLLGSSLLGVMAQRLVRLNCSQCVVEEKINDQVMKDLGLTKKNIFFKGAGCNACNNTGYHRRALVAELLEVTPDIIKMINDGASNAEITKISKEQGMTTLMQHAVMLAKMGKTSIDEVLALQVE